MCVDYIFLFVCLFELQAFAYFAVSNKLGKSLLGEGI